LVDPEILLATRVRERCFGPERLRWNIKIEIFNKNVYRCVCGRVSNVQMFVS